MGRAADCGLCGSPDSTPIPPAGYFHCPVCDLRYLDPAARLSPAEEHSRYLQHENNPDDPRYLDFLRPLLDQIRVRHTAGAKGLDFGAGPGPALAKMLRDAGFEVAVFDPFFWPDRGVLTPESYDFVTASEVAEHFYRPAEEFARLRELLKPGGTLGIMTSFHQDGMDFPGWYYRRDPTHVVFYSARTFHWIRGRFEFRRLELFANRIALLMA